MSTSGVTLAGLLKLKPVDLEKTLREHVDAEARATRPIPSVLGFATETATKKLNEALDIDLIDVLAGVWVKAKKLRTYKNNPKIAAGSTSVEPLGEHEITATEEPVISLSIAHVPLPELRLKLLLTVRVKSIVLSIEDAKIVEVAPGECIASVKLLYGKNEIKKLESQPVVFPGSIPIRPGLSIP